MSKGLKRRPGEKAGWPALGLEPCHDLHGGTPGPWLLPLGQENLGDVGQASA